METQLKKDGGNESNWRKIREGYLKQVEEVVYLGSDDNKEGRIEKEVSRRIQSSCVKCSVGQVTF